MNIPRSVSGLHWGADPLTLLNLYKSLIRSILDYACSIYGNSSENVMSTLSTKLNTVH